MEMVRKNSDTIQTGITMQHSFRRGYGPVARQIR